MKIMCSLFRNITMLAVAFIASTSLAFESEGQIRAGIGFSDNVGRSAQSEVDDTIATVGFDYGVSESTNRLRIDLRVNADYLDYLDDTFDAEWIGGLSGLADLTLIEERLTWEVRENFGQQLADAFQPARPGNRENVNFFSTGPTLSLYPSQRTPIRLDARYSKISYEERPFDNDRLSGTLSIGRDTSRASTISLNVRGERTEFDNDGLTPPVEEYAAFVRFESVGNRTSLDIELGYNQVEAAGLEGDGLLASVTWMKETSVNGTLRMTGGSRYSDQGDIFRWYQDITNDLRETTDSPDSPAPFQNNYFTLGYMLTHVRYSVDLSVDWSQEDYKGDLGIDRDIYRAAAYFQREVSRTVFASASLRFHRREFKYQDRRDDDLILGLGAGYRFTPGFAVSVDYQHFQRNSVSIGADFTENRIFLRAIYTPKWSR